jgi:hypothetical protein
MNITETIEMDMLVHASDDGPTAYIGRVIGVKKRYLKLSKKDTPDGKRSGSVFAALPAQAQGRAPLTGGPVDERALRDVPSADFPARALRADGPLSEGPVGRPAGRPVRWPGGSAASLICPARLTITAPT